MSSITMFTKTNRNPKLCPCGSNLSLKVCCAPIIQRQLNAKTPEQLMRSRYTAYVLRNSNYLLETWDIMYRPESISFEHEICWLGLQITDTHKFKSEDNTGYVSFIATSICDDSIVEMKEKSTFIKNNGMWFYQKGDLTTTRKTIALNGKCPCGSGKKFKRCCRQP